MKNSFSLYSSSMMLCILLFFSINITNHLLFSFSMHGQASFSLDFGVQLASFLTLIVFLLQFLIFSSSSPMSLLLILSNFMCILLPLSFSTHCQTSSFVDSRIQHASSFSTPIFHCCKFFFHHLSLVSLLFYVHFVFMCAFCNFFNCGFDVVTLMTHFCLFSCVLHITKIATIVWVWCFSYYDAFWFFHVFDIVEVAIVVLAIVANIAIVIYGNNFVQYIWTLSLSTTFFFKFLISFLKVFFNFFLFKLLSKCAYGKTIMPSCCCLLFCCKFCHHVSSPWTMWNGWSQWRSLLSS